MLRDDGPQYNIGYGVNSRRDLLINDQAQSGPNPEAGYISKKLHDHPIMKFFAISAASIVGAHIAGQVVKKGGLRLGLMLEEKAGEEGFKWVDKASQVYRETQKTLDEFQGITRTTIDENLDNKLFTRLDDGRVVSGSQAFEDRSWYRTKAEREEAMLLGVDPPIEWGYKREVQQRLVRQARRLPYELPAMYVTQKAIINPISGEDPNKRKVNWANPADVISDFVAESTKNLAFNLLPFEAGSGVATSAYRKAMTYGDDLVELTAKQKMRQDMSVSLKAVLNQVGADISDVLNKGIKFSSQSSGAFSAGVSGMREEAMHAKPFWREFSSGVVSRNLNYANAGQNTNYGLKGLKDEIFANSNLLDQIPGPLKGIKSGFEAAKGRFSEIGTGYDAFQRLMTLGAKADLNKDQIFAMRHVLSGGSQLEDLAGTLNVLSGGAEAGTNAWRQGSFYKQMLGSEYQNALEKQLVNRYGVDPKAANRFAKLSRISVPGSGKGFVDLASRVHFGETPLYASGTEGVTKELYARLGKFAKNGQAEAISANLPKAISDVDNLFKNKDFISGLDTKLQAQWTHAKDRLIPQFGDEILNQAKVPWQTFHGDLTPSQHSFLTRKTAQSLGIKLVDDYGHRIGNDQIALQLSKHGIDNQNISQMRGFLGATGAIAKPWQYGGRNAFGFRPMLASEAVARGYFRGSDQVTKEIDDLLGSMKHNDPVSRTIGDYTLPGVYMTSSGKILDTNSLKRKATRLFDTMSSDIQIPMVHIKPFEAMFSKYFKAKRDRSVLQFVPGMTNQAFLSSAKEHTDDFYLWMRSGGRGYKGTVHSVGIDSTGTVMSSQEKGLYEAAPTDRFQVGGRHARLAIGERGQVPRFGEPREQGWIGKKIDQISGPGRSEQLKRFFSVSDNQDGSITNFIDRLRNREADIRNPYVMAKLLEDGKLNTKKYGDVSLVGGELKDSAGNVIKGGTAREVADAFEGGFNNRYLRNFGFSTRTIKALENSPVGNLFKFDFTGLKPKTFNEGVVNLSDLKTPAEIVEAAELMLKGDATLMKSWSPENRKALQRAQKSFLGAYLDEASGPSYWNELAPQSARSETIHTRIDQLKADMYRYIATKEGIRTSSHTDFNNAIPNVLSELDKLKSLGAISTSEYSESMAALLSLQVNFVGFKTYSSTSSPLTNVQAVISDIIGSGANHAMLDEISSGRIGVRKNLWLSKITPGFRKNLSVSEYGYDGFEYNPFGPTKTAFIPSVGTAMARDPRGAIKGMFGFGTWANPDTYSAASIPAVHMFERLNRFGGPFNLALNTEDFKGPLDFYARGIIGKRVLPIAGTAAVGMTLDRTAGGIVYGKDEDGRRRYEPLVTGQIAKGLAYGQAFAAGVIPGGQNYEEKRYEIFEGETAIRAGRFFPIGNTPWRGGKIKYYRPSWYRKFVSGYDYTEDSYGSPMERLAFGYDFSPLRPLSPYHYEKKHYEDRPYPVTGDYFTGPWGPLAPLLNMSVGKLLKPQKQMHQEELAAGLSQYMPVGTAGAALSPVDGMYAMGGGGGVIGGFGAATGSIGVGYGAGGGGGGNAGFASVAQNNRRITAAAGYAPPTIMGAASGYAGVQASNAYYMDAASNQKVFAGTSMQPSIVQASEPITQGSYAYQSKNLGYHAQELFGIYGFAFGAVRSKLGIGNQDFSPLEPVLQSSTKMTSSTKKFWDLNIGGLGDAPLPMEGDLANMEFSEIIRRFVPKERTDVDYINPIPNTMSQKAPWLPGPEYIEDFQHGDPFSKGQEMEMRLPGSGYEKLHDLHSDRTGRYGVVDQFKILGDVAPYSQQYRALDKVIDSMNPDPAYRDEIDEVRQQVEAKSHKLEFSPYKYKYSSPDELGVTNTKYAIGRAWEAISHANSFFNTKFMPNYTAVEEWERNNVYGATFPEWSHPVEGFLKPAIHNASQRNPISASLVMGTIGSMFGVSTKMKAFGAVIGGAIGFGASAFTNTQELITGDRYIPRSRKEEVALEENADILTYVRNKHLAAMAQAGGNADAAAQFEKEASQTMYGADVHSGNIEQLAAAIPNRKREHFKEMLFAPKEEREQILSTAGRLERRFYEAAWGQKVEQLPDLNEYFQKHELPPEDSSFWLEDTRKDFITIKMGQSMGLSMSEMGYYPQQIREANLVNPVYPEFSQRSSAGTIRARLQRLMDAQGIRGSISEVQNPFGYDNIDISAGMY